MWIERVFLESRINALKGRSLLTDEVLAIEGMSDARMRHLLNNIGQRVKTYLEVGCYHGSTLASAAFQNQHLTAIGIDDFSEQFERWNVGGTPRQQLSGNLQRFVPHATFVEADFRQVDVGELPKLDCYLYDGAHHVDVQCQGIVHFAPAFADNCLLLVDDWKGEPVREGTIRGLEKINQSWQVVTSTSLWDTWNGLGAFILKRLA
jgi:hypothetical protein